MKGFLKKTLFRQKREISRGVLFLAFLPIRESDRAIVLLLIQG
jgi:hypothetical protein